MDQERKDENNSRADKESNDEKSRRNVQIVNEPEKKSETNRETTVNNGDRQQGNITVPSTSAAKVLAANIKAGKKDGQTSKNFEMEEIDLHANEASNTSNVTRRSSDPDIAADNGDPNVPVLLVLPPKPWVPIAPTEEFYLKFVFVGDFAVGKTAIIQQYLTKEFKENYQVTIGAEFEMRHYRYDLKTTINIQLWDIAGQERTRLVTRQFYKDADVIILVCDVTRNKTFESLTDEKGWIPMLQKQVLQFDSKPVPIILLANKCDLPHQQITANDLEQVSSKYDLAAWRYTSAREDKNIDEAMEWAIKLALMGQRRARSYARVRQPNIQVSDQDVNLEMVNQHKSTFRKCCRTN